MIRTTTAATLMLAATTLAQPAITFDIENDTLLPGQSTTVTMYAGYGGTDFAVALLETDLLTSVGSDGWSDALRLEPMDGPGTSAGSASTTGWDGLVAGQLHFPTEPDIMADPTNPIAFWRATYTAPLDAAAPFDVDLSTMTIRYDVYVNEGLGRSESRLADLVEGSGTIHVIPAPASASLLAVGAVALRRRR